jgi:hypothetical protein
MRTLTLPLVLALAAHCGPAASAEEPKPPSAQLRIISATSGISQNSSVTRYATEACDKGERIAKFNFTTPGGKKEVEVPIGARLYLVAYAHVEPPVGAQTVGKTSCRGMASFVPEHGKVYEVRHDLKARNCPLLITDASGAAPKTFQKHKPAGLCKKAD